MDGALGFGSDTNSLGWKALADGSFHVGYAALGVVVLGLLLLSVHLWLGVVLLILGVGIFVDAWAHGFFH